jgi:hypothetical protein
VVLTDKHFCASCASAFFLIVRNCLRFSIISGISFILMFLGKAVIMSSSGLIAYIIIMNSELTDKVTSPIFPTIVSVFIAYIIASVFLSVYSFASTAILHCFILSEDIGSKEHPACLNEFIKVNDEHNEKRNKGKGGNDKKEDEKKDGAPPPGEGPSEAVKGKDEKKANDMA